MSTVTAAVVIAADPLEWQRGMEKAHKARLIIQAEIEAHAAWIKGRRPPSLVDIDRDRYGRIAICDDCGVPVSRCLCNRGVSDFNFSRR